MKGAVVKNTLDSLPLPEEKLRVPVFRGRGHNMPESLRKCAYSHLEERVS